MKVNPKYPHLKPEDQFILACLQHQPSLPEFDLDEELLLHRMAYHRVTSMVYQHLIKIDKLHIFSPQTQAQIKEHYYLNIYRNLAISSVVKQISQVLGKNNIEMMTLKGAMFIEAFSDYALVREMSDLDIMVKPEQLYQAIELLSTLDFEDTENFRSCKNKRKNWSIQYASNAICLQSQRSDITSVLVELHWQLFSIFNQTNWSDKDLWNRAKYCSDKGFYCLNPVDALLHLCAHQCNDLQIYLYGLVDVANILTFWREQLDWIEVIHRAKSQRILLHLVNILRLCNELLNTPLPEIYLTALKSYELAAQPGYDFLINRLFHQEFIENANEATSLLKVFRRLEYANFWQGLWFELKLLIPLGIRLRLDYYIARHLRKRLGFHQGWS
ncbi:MAG TPA: hypothetical protein DCE56_04915 [Cyanobacteria bacterium UBA8553]|nr:hypothetical protein [Cyanobacteria bacterium UBA8553]HAJ58858.1 hypothetical protein [Cyanobacteria bacterium UBA8543]